MQGTVDSFLSACTIAKSARNNAFNLRCATISVRNSHTPHMLVGTCRQRHAKFACAWSHNLEFNLHCIKCDWI